MILSLMGIAHASSLPQQVQAAIGGVVIKAIQKTIGGRNYVLAAQEPYADGAVKLYLLKPFAGSFTTSWTTPNDLSINPDRPSFTVDLLDLNRDGFPEVYWVNDTSGNEFGTQTYSLYDTGTTKQYDVELSYDMTGAPAHIRLPPDLQTTKAAPFLKFLEPLISKSSYLKDTRNPAAMTYDSWMTKNGAFLDQAIDIKSIPITNKISSEACLLKGAEVKSLNYKDSRFIALFEYGVIQYQKSKGTCSLIVAQPPHEVVTGLSVKGSTLTISYLVEKKKAVYNIANHRLEWKY